jgi:hypothetical protein
MSLRIALVLLLSFSLTGCGLYVVKKSAPAGNHHGIPFYVKTAGCQRQIVRLKPYYLLTLTTTRTGEKTGHSESTTVCREHYTADDLLRLFDDVRSGNGPDIEPRWKAVIALSSTCDLHGESIVGSKNSFLASDSIAAYTFVDYQTPYTLNVRKPIIGSASATTKLSPDGTLSEGTAQMEDKTLSTLISAVPTSDLIKSAAGIAAAAAPTVSYELKIEEKAVKFTWTYHDPATHSACENDPGLVSDPPTTGKPDFVVEDAGGDRKPADDGNTIKVNGSIQLPKTQDASAPK